MNRDLSARSPLAFFALVFALALPFWPSGALSDWQILPGLPVSALMAMCPLLAASLIVFRAGGFAGVRNLLRRAFDYRKIAPKSWYLPIFLLMPSQMIASYGLMRAMGTPLPSPHVSPLPVEPSASPQQSAFGMQRP